MENKIINKIIKPTLKGLSELGTEYKGFLYAGLMIVNNEPFLIEYNVRMGDPECQTILPKLKNDLAEVFLACCNTSLDQISLDWTDKKSLCIVVCSNGYPDVFRKNVEIKNIKSIKSDESNYLFHAGTVQKDNKVYAIGGRVLNFVSLSDDFSESKNKVMQNLNKLNWSGGFYRKDIGYKVIK
jgi:phosphoribosylamine--glycine ligase